MSRKFFWIQQFKSKSADKYIVQPPLTFHVDDSEGTISETIM